MRVRTAPALARFLPLLLAAACAGDPVTCPDTELLPSTGAEGAPEDTPEPEAAAPAPARESDATLLLDGTPEVPDALRARLQQYTNTRAASLVSLNDDGTTALVATRFAETRQLHLVSEPMGARYQITFGDEPVREASLVPGAPDTVLYLSDVGGSEDHQLFRLDMTTGRAERLTDGESKHAGLVVAPSGAKAAYSSNARNGRDMDVHVRDLASGEVFRFEREGYWYPLDFSRDGTKLLVGRYVSINDSRLWLVDLESGDATRLSPEDAPASYEVAVFGRDADTVYAVSDRGGEFRQLYQLDASAPEDEWRLLTGDIPWNVEHLALAPDGRQLAFTTNEEGWSKLHLLDTRRGRITEARNVPQALIRGLSWAPRANVLGLSLASATLTGDAYTYDPRRGRLTRWTVSETGGLDPEQFVEPELVRFESFDEREIPAFYYRPEGEGPFPVMLYIHGGPESQARPWFSPLTQYLVSELGVAVIAPNVRGSDGYGKSYLLLDNGRLREDSVRDIGALLDWVGEREELDAERAAVYGGSYGGYMVLASLVHFGERLRAGIDVVGISHFVTFLENTRDYRRDLRRQEYGDESDPEMRRFLESISPLNHVGEIQSALFVAQGANDPRVPASEAEQIVEAVRGSGRDVWYMLARNEGHGFRKKENRDVFFELSVLFLERHLLGRGAAGEGARGEGERGDVGGAEGAGDAGPAEGGEDAEASEEPSAEEAEGAGEGEGA